MIVLTSHAGPGYVRTASTVTLVTVTTLDLKAKTVIKVSENCRDLPKLYETMKICCIFS